MSVILKIGDKYPKNCEQCILFVEHLGISSYCVAGVKILQSMSEYFAECATNLLNKESEE